MTARTRWLRRGVALCLTLVVAWLLLSLLVAWRMTRRAARCAEPAPDGVEEIRLATRDGEYLGAWFLPGDRPPAVLVLHGNGGSRSACRGQLKLLTEAGHPALLVTLRAHGDSSGDTNDFGHSARHDVVAAVEWLDRRCPRQPIVIWGQSLGSAAALFAGEELGDRVAGYLLECPYQDLRTAVCNRTRHYLPVGLDQLAYAGLVTVAPVVLPEFDAISPRAAAAKLPRNVPILILAGGADRRAQASEAHAIAAAAGRVEVFADGDHLQLEASDPARYRRLVIDFLRRVVGRNPLPA